MKRSGGSIADRIVHAMGVTVLMFIAISMYVLPAGYIFMLATGIVHHERPVIPAFDYWECVVITGALRLLVPTEERKT